MDKRSKYALRLNVMMILLFLCPVFASQMVFDKGVYDSQKIILEKATTEEDIKSVIKVLKDGIAPHKLTAALYLGEHGDRSALRTLQEMNLRGGGWSGINHKKYPGFSHDPSAEYAIAIYKILNRDKPKSKQIEALFEILDGRGHAVPSQVSR